MQALFGLENPLQPGSGFDLVIPIALPPVPEGDVVSVTWSILDPQPGAPTGFETTQPYYVGTVDVTRDLGGAPAVHTLDLTLQLTAFALDPQGQLLSPLGLTPQPVLLPPDGVSGLELVLQGVVTPERGAGPASGILIQADLRAHASRGARLFADGFESGDTDRWSSTSP